MGPGDKLRLRGPAGAPFAVTVGRPFSAEYINAQLASGEWTTLDGSKAPAPAPAQSPTAAPASASTDRPPVNAPKADWIAYVVRRRLLSPEDAKAYTKADLIDLTN